MAIHPNRGQPCRYWYQTNYGQRIAGLKLAYWSALHTSHQSRNARQNHNAKTRSFVIDLNQNIKCELLLQKQTPPRHGEHHIRWDVELSSTNPTKFTGNSPQWSFGGLTKTNAEGSLAERHRFFQITWTTAPNCHFIQKPVHGHWWSHQSWWPTSTIWFVIRQKTSDTGARHRTGRRLIRISSCQFGTPRTQDLIIRH